MTTNTITVGGSSAAREIAYVTKLPAHARASLFWLSGFMSDMASTKASAVADYARDHELGATRFDYSGHGQSSGAFADGSIGRWLEEARAVFSALTRGPQIVIGSSMGGHIALLLLKALLRDAPEEAKRIHGMILIAPAWDMTEELMWKKFPEATRRDILRNGFHLRPSAYDSPYTITRALIEDGRSHLLARQPFDVGRPIIILQGLLDEDVPAAHTRELMTFLRGDVRLIEIADGEHRLSRPADLEILYDAISNLAGAER